MKTIAGYLLILSLLFTFKGIAQKPGDTRSLSNTYTASGRRELKREKKVQRREMLADKRHQRKGRRKNTQGLMVLNEKHKVKPVKHHKERHRSKDKDKENIASAPPSKRTAIKPAP
jgi:hypothetical protein